ncbi:MAG: helix-turn-helix domain-containing protein [Desulfobacterales bacterium]|nr:helix-turn-helix domain-containing protein [Desulfobacterales bacterium]
MPISPNKTYFRVDEIAKYFSVSKRTVYRLIESRKLKSVRIGNSLRIHVSEILRHENPRVRTRSEACAKK